MKAVLGAAAFVVLLLVASWMFVFGGVGALLAPRRGRTRFSGFLWGAIFGPIGWAVVAFSRPRSGSGPAPEAVRGVDVVDVKTDASGAQEVPF